LIVSVIAKVVQVEVAVKPQPTPTLTAPKIKINQELVISAKELETKIAQLNEAMVLRNQAIVFSKDPATGKDVV
jgi:hypothetical protein